ncbi:MAG: fibrobacter succinogenes major paralogous domain-containing protein [Fibromonadales bacterium]|nr:fibrobacter succinogenes major paralogous domain-containing protein [Fibromonadales bacterium]
MIKIFGFTLIIAILFAGCSTDTNNSIDVGDLQFNPNINYESFTDSRDGQSYRTVKIGNRIWMAENFSYANHSCGVSWCYENNDAYCAAYGRLYDWCAAMSACPDGWRLPSDADWYDLIRAAGSQEIAGEKFKSQTGWNSNGNGTDEFGFSALPGGYGRSCHRAFIGAGSSGFWWGATELGAWIMGADYEGMEASFIGANAGLSVRCVRD